MADKAVWKTVVRDTVREKTTFAATVDFFKDEEQIDEKLFRESSLEQLKINVNRALKQYIYIDELDLASLEGDYDSTIVVDVKTKTTAEIAADEYAADVRTMKSMEKAIAAGVKKADDKDYTDLVAKIKTNYIEEYAKYFY